MKKPVLKVGDRVKHSFLGTGVVIKLGGREIDYLAEVFFDQDPPFRYNLGLNPSWEFIRSLEQ